MADGSSMTSVVVLKNAHVIDPAQGIDGVATVAAQRFPLYFHSRAPRRQT